MALVCISIRLCLFLGSRVSVLLRTVTRLVWLYVEVWLGCRLTVRALLALHLLRLMNVYTGVKLKFSPHAGLVFLPLERVAINAVLTLTTIRLLLWALGAFVSG